LERGEKSIIVILVKGNVTMVYICTH
jgi:hypothetical protein